MPSHVIRRFTYDPDRQALEILFLNGKHYEYEGVPADVGVAMKLSFAKGEFFNARIRGRYRVKRLDAPQPDLFDVQTIGE